MHKTIREQYLLLRLKISRDPETFGALYDIYVDRIYRFVYFKVSSEQVAEDITADVFLRAWQYIAKPRWQASDDPQSDAGRSPVPWASETMYTEENSRLSGTWVKNSVDNLNALLYQIARNLVIDHYRKSGRETSLHSYSITDTDFSEDVVVDPDSSHLSYESDIDLSIDIEFLKRCLPQLRSDHHEIIVLRFIEELNIGEIANILNIKKGNVRVQIHRAIKELRLIVEREQNKIRNTKSEIRMKSK